MTTPSVDEFAAGRRDWLAEHRAEAPPDYGAICPPELIDAGVAWQRLLYDAGYAGIHWPVEHGGAGPDARAPGGVADRVRRGRRAAGAQHGRPGARRRGAAALRHARAAGPAPARRRCAATRCGASCSPSPAPAATSASLTHAGRARRRPLHRQRPEGVVLGRAGQQLGHPHGPHRPRRGQARRHLVLPVPDGPARHRGPPAQADDRRGGVRRGLLHRRRAARPTACSARCTAGGASG